MRKRKKNMKIPYCNLVPLLLDELKIQKQVSEDNFRVQNELRQGTLFSFLSCEVLIADVKYLALTERNHALEEKMQMVVKETTEQIARDLKEKYENEIEELNLRVRLLILSI